MARLRSKTGTYDQGVVASSTAPQAAFVGQIWYNSNTGVTYQYTTDGTSKFWLDLTSGGIGESAARSVNKFEDLHSRLNKSVKDLREEVELIEKRLMCELKQLNVNLGERVGVLEKYRYILIGGAIIIGLWGPRIVDNGWFSWLQ